MAQDSKIEWTHHTANLWHGCTEVHEGCDHCYARVLSHRWGRELWGNDSPRMMINSVWKDLARYQKLAAAVGEIHRVFVGSMMDIFEKPFFLIDTKGEKVTDGVHDYPADSGQLRDQLFDEISEGKYPNLLFLLLTKRPSNINKYIPESWKVSPPANVMFGTSPVNQETFDNLWLHLARVNGKRFLSVEPMLGPITLKSYCKGCDGLVMDTVSPVCSKCGSRTVNPEWIICGGESGHGKRPMDLEWARHLREKSKYASIPFFMKQIDKVQTIPDDLMIRKFPDLS